jgi:hypothetical protein
MNLLRYQNGRMVGSALLGGKHPRSVLWVQAVERDHFHRIG